jgi:hypothetical protein
MIRRWKEASLALLFLGTAALAETRVRVVQEADRTVVRKRTAVDFTETALEGDLTKPEGSYVLERTRADLPNLMNIRDDFNAKLRQSVDNL